MAILPGFEKYKRHLKVDDENYKLVSEWTHSDTVEMNNGNSLTETINHLNETINMNISFGNIYDFKDCIGYGTTTTSSISKLLYKYIFYKDGIFITSAPSYSGFGGNYYSADGINWTKGANLGIVYTDHDLLYANGIYLLAGSTPQQYSNGIQYSYDFKTWTIVKSIGGGGESDVSNTLKNCLGYGNGIFVAGGNKEIIYSMNGTVWKQATLPESFDGEVLDIAYGNGVFVAVSSKACLYSIDGITWLDCYLYDSSAISNLNSVIYNNGKFVAVRNTGYIVFSYDGINWYNAVEIVKSTTRDLYCIKYINDKYISVGENGSICYSYDGVFWEEMNSPTTRNLHSICYGNGKIVIGGDNIIIYTSFKKNDIKNLEACINELYNKKMVYANVKLTSDSWVYSTTSYGNLYTQEIPIVEAYDFYPEYFLKTLHTAYLNPTESEQAAYDLINAMQLDIDNKKLIFYASDKPQKNILVVVRNVLI